MSIATPMQVRRGLLVPLAASGLAGSVVDIPDVPFAPDEWFSLVHICQEGGLLGMLAMAAQRGAVTLTPAQAEELAVLENEAASLALLVEQRVVRLSALLAAAGVAHRLLGAPPRARLGYRQAGIRMFEKATLLVDPGGFDVGTPWGIDVQHTLRLPDGRPLEVAHLSHPPTLLALADRPVPTASIDEHLVLACLDLAFAGAGAATAVGTGGDGRGGGSVAAAAAAEMARPQHLVIRRDIAELALSKEIDPARVQRTAEAWGVVNQVTQALVQSWDLFGLADRTRLSVWAHRITDSAAPVQRSTNSPPPSRPARPSNPRSLFRRAVRKVRKLAPSKVAARAAAWRSKT